MWLFIRCFANYISFVIMLIAFNYIRLSTLQCFISLNPVFLVIFAVFILNEKFHFRYILGIIICFFGATLLIFNDKQSNTKNISIDAEEEGLMKTIVGIIYGLGISLTMAILLIAIKVIVKEDLDFDDHIFYVSAINGICAFVGIIVLNEFELLLNSYFWAVTLCFIASFIWILGTNLLVLSNKNIDIVKLTSIGYVQIVLAFIFGVLFLNESVALTDIVGSLIIFGYNIYNAYNPIKEN